MSKPRNLALLTDLYELTMAQSYFQHGMFAPATFSLFIRRYPEDRAYFVSAGLEEVLSYLESLRFTQEDLDYLSSTGIFAQEFLHYLSDLRFTGDVWAIPEGRLFFRDEPVLELTAPIIEAQIVETFIINQINLQSIVATKASRCLWAARGRPLMDFSLRRTQGIDAGMKVARASYIAGFRSTSNVLAGKVYGIPVAGTMAHSYVSSFESEIDAFRAFARSFPERSTLLIDTYDTIQGAHNAAVVGRELQALGQRFQGVRLDSGDMAQLSQEVRKILDEAGLQDASIFASGSLDEFELEDLLHRGAKIDAFGVGTKMGVSADAPWSDIAYKLVQYQGRPVLKLSQDKVSLPGEKQVHRFQDEHGNLSHDVIGLRDEGPPSGEPLLSQAMRKGKAIQPQPSLDEIRQTFADEFSRLPDGYKALRHPPTYPVDVSQSLQEMYHRIESGQSIEKIPTVVKGKKGKS
ncbi:MAG: nicotinate phosphoribosyltransferase [Chloroflexi bacterium]|nr:nicotinate phosphoribosyltransferase [Chloroflexota bacterium]